MLKVQYARVDRLTDDPSRYVISDGRLQKLSRMKPGLPRLQAIGAELILQNMIHAEQPQLSLPVPYTPDVHGKPCWEIQDLYFNLSHSGIYAACALSRLPVGIDIQQLTEYKEAISRRFFTPEEQAQLVQAEEKDRAFTRLWTLKESYLKAKGLGLSGGLDSFSVQFEDPIRCSDPAASFWHTEIPGYHLAVCVLEPSPLCPDSFEEIELMPLR